MLAMVSWNDTDCFSRALLVTVMNCLFFTAYDQSFKVYALF